MGLFNQGWGCRCDNCEEQLIQEIGTYSQAEVVAIAADRGWIKVGQQYYCSKECQQEHKQQISGGPPKLGQPPRRKRR